MISIITAPDCFAINGKDFAGSKVLEVPIESNVSQVLDIRLAWANVSCGKFSPNQTTSGCNKLLQFKHGGGTVL